MVVPPRKFAAKYCILSLILGSPGFHKWQSKTVGAGPLHLS